MMEPTLSKQAQTILAQLKKDLDKRLLTDDQYEYLRLAMLERESRAIVRRFIITTAGLISALSVILAAAITTFNSWGGPR